MRAAGFKDERTRVDRREEPGCKPDVVCRTYPSKLERSAQGSDRVLFVGADPAARPPHADKPPTTPPPGDRDVPPTTAKPPEEEKPGSFF